MNLERILVLAKNNANVRALDEASAKLCLDVAVSLYAQGMYGYARARALKSLQHSVGVFHPDYAKACK